MIQSGQISAPGQLRPGIDTDLIHGPPDRSQCQPLAIGLRDHQQVLQGFDQAFQPFYPEFEIQVHAGEVTQIQCLVQIGACGCILSCHHQELVQLDERRRQIRRQAGSFALLPEVDPALDRTAADPDVQPLQPLKTRLVGITTADRPGTPQGQQVIELGAVRRILQVESQCIEWSVQVAACIDADVITPRLQGQSPPGSGGLLQQGGKRLALQPQGNRLAVEHRFGLDRCCGLRSGAGLDAGQAEIKWTIHQAGCVLKYLFRSMGPDIKLRLLQQLFDADSRW